MLAHIIQLQAILELLPNLNAEPDSFKESDQFTWAMIYNEILYSEDLRYIIAFCDKYDLQCEIDSSLHGDQRIRFTHKSNVSSEGSL